MAVAPAIRLAFLGALLILRLPVLAGANVITTVAEEGVNDPYCEEKIRIEPRSALNGFLHGRGQVGSPQLLITEYSLSLLCEAEQVDTGHFVNHRVRGTRLIYESLAEEFHG